VAFLPLTNWLVWGVAFGGSSGVTNAAGVLRMADLRRACLVLLDVAEERFGGQVGLSELGVDYYWNLDLRAAFDMAGQPEQHVDCGQVSDDLAELTGLLRRGPDEVVSLWHDLQHLLGLLRLLAYLDLPDVSK
jgi:hypothetical protein